MRLTQVCEGCGEEFITYHGVFCPSCAVVPIRRIKQPATILSRVNERNKESKQWERRKRQHRPSMKGE